MMAHIIVAEVNATGADSNPGDPSHSEAEAVAAANERRVILNRR
jgi:hypothetical protein